MTTQTTPLEALHERLREIGGCSNHGCYVVRPNGMGTNGPCHCLENRHMAQRVLNAYIQYVCAKEGIQNAIPKR